MTEENENSRERTVKNRPQRKPAAEAEPVNSDNAENGDNGDSSGEPREYINLQDLKAKKTPELLTVAEEAGVEGGSSMLKQELIFSILKAKAGAEL